MKGYSHSLQWKTLLIKITNIGSSLSLIDSPDNRKFLILTNLFIILTNIFIILTNLD
jgi:hypothetical protein